MCRSRSATPKTLELLTRNLFLIVQGLQRAECSVAIITRRSLSGFLLLTRYAL